MWKILHICTVPVSCTIPAEFLYIRVLCIHLYAEILLVGGGTTGAQGARALLKLLASGASLPLAVLIFYRTSCQCSCIDISRFLRFIAPLIRIHEDVSYYQLQPYPEYDLRWGSMVTLGYILLTRKGQGCGTCTQRS